MEDYTFMTGDHACLSEECRALAIKTTVLILFVFPVIMVALFILFLVIVGCCLAGMWLVSRLLCAARWIQTTCAARLMKTTTTYQCEQEEVHRWIEDFPEILDENMMKRVAEKKEKKKEDYLQII